MGSYCSLWYLNFSIVFFIKFDSIILFENTLAMKLIFFTVLLLLWNVSFVNAQFSAIGYEKEKMEIGGMYSLTSESFVYTGSNDLFKEIFQERVSHSYGINGNYIFKNNLFLKPAIYIRGFGAKGEAMVTTVDQPDGTGEIAEFNFNAKALDLQLLTGYYILNKEKFRLGIGAGYCHAFVLDQKYKFKDVVTDVDFYEKNFGSMKVFMEMGIPLSEKATLNVVPLWQKQIKGNSDSDFKQRGFGTEIGLSYRV